MKVFFVVLILAVSIYGDKLSVGFASINPAREIKSTLKEINNAIVKERHLNIRIKPFAFANKSNDEKEDISEILDDFSESLYDSLNRSGPSLSTKEQKEARFSDLQYKEVALTPKNMRKVWVFHEDRKQYGLKFLSSLAKEQKLDIIIFQKIAKRKWKKFGQNLDKKGKIKPTIVVFNNFSKAQSYSHPSILAKYFIDEEYEKMSKIIEDKSIEALKHAFSVGVINSSIDTIVKKNEDEEPNEDKEPKEKVKKLQVSDMSDIGASGGF